MSPLTLEQVLDPANQGKVACRVCSGCGQVDGAFVISKAKDQEWLQSDLNEIKPNEIRDKAVLGECICPQLVVGARKLLNDRIQEYGGNQLGHSAVISFQLMEKELQDILNRLGGLER